VRVCAETARPLTISVIKIKNNFLIRNNLEISYYCLLLKIHKCVLVSEMIAVSVSYCILSIWFNN